MDRSISIYDIFFIIMLYALFLIFALNYFGWIIDDLYIYFRYVNNFVTGKGLVYNPGEFTEGYSGFSWLMFLSVFGFLNLPLGSFRKSNFSAAGFSEFAFSFQNQPQIKFRKAFLPDLYTDTIQSPVYSLVCFRF